MLSSLPHGLTLAQADTADEFFDVFDVYLPVGVAVFVIVVALIAYVVIRFRSDEREFPKGANERTPYELSFAAFIGLVAAGLLVLTYTTMSDLGSASEGEAPGLEVQVTAAKWTWRFDYTQQGVWTQNEGRIPTTLVVPVNRPIRFRMTSVDVIHALWIPERRFKRDAFPGRTTTFTLTFPREGFQRGGGQCNQFCGLLHHAMDVNVDVVSPAEFQSWVRDKRAEAAR